MVHNEHGMQGGFARLELLVGRKGLMRLQQARVAVVGLGAVGSFAVEALARSGIGNLRLVDFDDIRPSNLNRQLLALQETVGRRKIDVAADRVRSINPDANVETRSTFFCAQEADALLGGGLDFVIDAIDSLGPKVDLIAAAVQRNIPLVSSMGAGGRSDPTCVKLTDISEVTGCTLARYVRKRIHRLGIHSGIAAVWSTERPKQPVEPAGEPTEEALTRGRVRRSQPTLVVVPGVFGLTAASHVINTLLTQGP